MDRWLAHLHEGQAVVQVTSLAFIMQAASDSAMFVVERASAKHPGLLIRVVQRPHSYSPELCDFLAHQWCVGGLPGAGLVWTVPVVGPLVGWLVPGFLDVTSPPAHA